MSSYLSMKQKLEPLSLYSFDSTLVSAELMSYAVALDYLISELDTLLCESFISTASGFGIEIRESCVGKIRDDLDLQTRRNMLLKRQNISVSDFTLEKFKVACESLDFDCQIYESPLTLSVCAEAIRSYSQAERSWIKKELISLLPAHLNAFIYFDGLSWSEFENNSKSFSQLELMNYTWDDIENLTT